MTWILCAKNEKKLHIYASSLIKFGQIDQIKVLTREREMLKTKWVEEEYIDGPLNKRILPFKCFFVFEVRKFKGDLICPLSRGNFCLQ